MVAGAEPADRTRRGSPQQSRARACPPQTAPPSGTKFSAHQGPPPPRRAFLLLPDHRSESRPGSGALPSQSCIASDTGEREQRISAPPLPLANPLVAGTAAGSGDAEGAAAAYQRAVDSGHPDQAPRAAFGLGVPRQDRGDTDGARAAYQPAADSGHPDAAPMAARNLGLLLQGQGDTDGAAAAYRRAIDSRHPDAAPMAAYNLGVLLEGRGLPTAVRAAVCVQDLRPSELPAPGGACLAYLAGWAGPLCGWLPWLASGNAQERERM